MRRQRVFHPAHGKAEVVPLLLEAGADVSLVNDDRNSTFFLARVKDHVGIAELLKKAGATN